MDDSYIFLIKGRLCVGVLLLFEFYLFERIVYYYNEILLREVE